MSNLATALALHADRDRASYLFIGDRSPIGDNWLWNGRNRGSISLRDNNNLGGSDNLGIRPVDNMLRNGRHQSHDEAQAKQKLLIAKSSF